MKRPALAVLAAAIGLVGWAASAGAPPKDRPPFGFDHLVHAGQVSVAGKSKLTCTQCHRLDVRSRPRGRPDHKTCFGSCHGKAPVSASKPGTKKLSRQHRRVCGRCHSPTAIGRYMAGATTKLSVRYPPYLRDRDYGIAFSHKKHDPPTRVVGASPGGCRTCHDRPGTNNSRNLARPTRRKKMPAHARCVGCHSSPRKPGVPTMKMCTTCHKAAYGPAADPHQKRSAYPVTSTFSHQLHRRRLPAGGDCRTCHSNIASADKLELATPTTSVCAGCHDGVKAFSTITPECNRCHKDQGSKTLRPRAPRKRFSHQAHRGRGMRIPCATCHQLSVSGQPRSAARTHAPCSDAGCHRKEFKALRPTICGACHVSIEPWRKLHHDRQPPQATEFGAHFSHKAHLAGAKPRLRASCQSCHKRGSGQRDLGLPRDHASCTGSGCHTVGAAGAKPALKTCTGCHGRGIARQRENQRRSARFTVRKGFRHKGHLIRKGGAKVACSQCHSRATRATTAANMPTPSKASCAGCHNGKTAFKVTGHGCAKCHAR